MTTQEHCFRLFVAGDEPNSRLAEANLRALCQQHLPGHHAIEVVDVLQNFEVALQAQIFVAPTVVMTAPRTVTLYGTLVDKAAVLSALGL